MHLFKVPIYSLRVLDTAYYLHPQYRQAPCIYLQGWFICISSLEICIGNALNKHKFLWGDAHFRIKKIKPGCLLWLSSICIGINEHRSDTFRAQCISPSNTDSVYEFCLSNLFLELSYFPFLPLKKRKGTHSQHDEPKLRNNTHTIITFFKGTAWCSLRRDCLNVLCVVKFSLAWNRLSFLKEISCNVSSSLILQR